jgi:hypothetical protein
MSELAEVRARDRISQGPADVKDGPPAMPSWLAYVTSSVFAILCMVVTAAWCAFLVWGATWLFRR